MEVNKDVALVPTGPDAERLGAMMAGRIDATFFTSSAAAPARKQGFAERSALRIWGSKCKAMDLPRRAPTSPATVTR